MEMLQNLGQVFWKFSTTTPNKTHKGSTCSCNGTWWCWPWLTRTCFNKFGKQSISQNMRSCLSISSGCQITNFAIAVLRSCMYVESLMRKAEIGGYLQLRNITFLHCTISIYDQLGRWHLVTSCPKLAYSSRAAAFAVEILVQMGETASTAWKNSSGNLPVQLQQ